MGLRDLLREAVQDEGPPRPFDRIELKDGTGTKSLNVQQFNAFPFGERIKAICEGRMRFFKGNTEIPAKDATR